MAQRRRLRRPLSNKLFSLHIHWFSWIFVTTARAPGKLGKRVATLKHAQYVLSSRDYLHEVSPKKILASSRLTARRLLLYAVTSIAIRRQLDGPRSLPTHL